VTTQSTLRCVRCGYDLARLDTTTLGIVTCPECGTTGSLADLADAPRPPWPTRRQLFRRLAGATIVISMLAIVLAAFSWHAAIVGVTIAAAFGVLLPIIMAPDMSLMHSKSKRIAASLTAGAIAVNLTIAALALVIARIVTILT
jgi:phage FluMu protein Com/predicted outer membrane lipoprotein